MSYDDNARKFADYAGAAARVSAATGWLPSVILAHWALETGYFTSGSFREGNNIGGIKYVNQPQAYGSLYGHAAYANVELGIDDYIRVANLSFYKDIRGGSTAKEQIHLLHVSPWAEDQFQEGKLLDILNTYGLIGYDSGISAGPAPGGPSSGTMVNGTNLSNTDLTKYAGIGLAFVALMALAND